MALKKKYLFEETKTIDDCKCVYCGHTFDGKEACNANMDANTVRCPNCNKEMDVYLSVEYTCVPNED